MFYTWFLWQFDATKISIELPIKQWKCTQRTKELFVESFVDMLKDKATPIEIYDYNVRRLIDANAKTR